MLMVRGCGEVAERLRRGCGERKFAVVIAHLFTAGGTKHA
jgi:hypothetical protein